MLSLYFKIMMIFLKQYKQVQVTNSYMTIKSHSVYLKHRTRTEHNLINTSQATRRWRTG